MIECTEQKRTPKTEDTLIEDEMRWLEAPEKTWTSVQLPHLLLKNNFVSGEQSGGRLTLRYFRNEPDQTLRAKVLLGAGTQGPPGHVHGGCMAALLDEAMGGAAWMQSHMAVAAELTTRFQTMLPIGTRSIIEAKVTTVDGRKVRTQGLLRDEAGNVYCEGEALFIILGAKHFGALASEVAPLLSGIKASDA